MNFGNVRLGNNYLGGGRGGGLLDDDEVGFYNDSGGNSGGPDFGELGYGDGAPDSAGAGEGGGVGFNNDDYGDEYEESMGYDDEEDLGPPPLQPQTSRPMRQKVMPSAEELGYGDPEDLGYGDGSPDQRYDNDNDDSFGNDYNDNRAPPPMQPSGGGNGNRNRLPSADDLGYGDGAPSNDGGDGYGDDGYDDNYEDNRGGGYDDHAHDQHQNQRSRPPPKPVQRSRSHDGHDRSSRRRPGPPPRTMSSDRGDHAMRNHGRAPSSRNLSRNTSRRHMRGGGDNDLSKSWHGNQETQRPSITRMQSVRSSRRLTPEERKGPRRSMSSDGQRPGMERSGSQRHRRQSGHEQHDVRNESNDAGGSPPDRGIRRGSSAHRGELGGSSSHGGERRRVAPRRTKSGDGMVRPGPGSMMRSKSADGPLGAGSEHSVGGPMRGRLSRSKSADGSDMFPQRDASFRMRGGMRENSSRRFASLKSKADAYDTRYNLNKPRQRPRRPDRYPKQTKEQMEAELADLKQKGGVDQEVFKTDLAKFQLVWDKPAATEPTPEEEETKEDVDAGKRGEEKHDVSTENVVKNLSKLCF